MSDWKAQLMQSVHENMPFFAAATGGINYTRLTEAFLIAGGTAMLTAVITADRVSIKLAENIVSLSARVDRCEEDIRDGKNDRTQIRERVAACEAILKINK